MAHELMEKGFKDVHALHGGFDAWQKAGYPVEPKSEPKPPEQVRKSA